MSSTSDRLRSLFSESKLNALERVSSELKSNPTALDTHSREVRAANKQTPETPAGE